MYSQDYIDGQNNGIVIGLTIGLQAINDGGGINVSFTAEETQWSTWGVRFSAAVL